jgi:hypothetical protein
MSKTHIVALVFAMWSGACGDDAVAASAEPPGVEPHDAATQTDAAAMPTMDAATTDASAVADASSIPAADSALDAVVPGDAATDGAAQDPGAQGPNVDRTEQTFYAFD